MCMCDEAFGRSRPFSFLKDVIDTFFLMFAGDETALEGSTARSFRAVLTQKIKNYSDAGAAAAAAAGSGGSLSASLQSADAAAAALEAEAKMAKMKLVKSELDSLATSAKQNIDKVISRGEAIESLVDRTGHLSTSSDAFRKKSKRLNQRLCWENLKLKLLMACAITVRPWHDGHDRWRRVCARPSLRGAGARVAHHCLLFCFPLSLSLPLSLLLRCRSRSTSFSAFTVAWTCTSASDEDRALRRHLSILSPHRIASRRCRIVAMLQLHRLGLFSPSTVFRFPFFSPIRSLHLPFRSFDRSGIPFASAGALSRSLFQLSLLYSIPMFAAFLLLGSQIRPSRVSARRDEAGGRPRDNTTAKPAAV